MEDHTENQTRTSSSHQPMKAGSFECKSCESKFSLKKNYERHRREAIDSDGNPRHECGKDWCTGKILKAHLKFTHQNLSCLACNQCFTSKQALERHVKKAVSLKCSVCNQVFCNKQAYRFHMSNVHLE